MEKVLGFQISMLGSFKNIQPDLIMTQKVSNALGDDGFIPATLEVNILDPQSKAVTSDTRFQMVSKDQMWAVRFFADRIDINYEYKGGEQYYSDISTVLAKAKDICAKTFFAFAETTCIRLAVNAKVLLKDMDIDQKQEFIKRFAIVPKALVGAPVTEWGTRINVPTIMNFGDKSCVCNRIVEILDFVGLDSVHKEIKPRIGISMDFNTDQTNTTLIYKYDDLLNFADATCPLMKTVASEIGGE